MENKTVTNAKIPAPKGPDTTPNEPATPLKVPAMFRPADWLCALLTFLVIWGVYLYTLAPELTLEDSGELCTGSYYAGIPHPPGYPFWSIYSWLWTVIVPFGNVAWRVEVGESFGAAMGCALVTLMVCRGSALLVEGLEVLSSLTKRWETAICSVAGVVAGLLIGFDGFVWSESVAINRISLFAVPWLALVLALLMRWAYAPHQRRYLYIAMFCYGICGTIHQSLILAVMGVETVICLVQPKIGRDLTAVNSFFYLMGLLCMHSVPAMQNMTSAEQILFHSVGLSSLGVTVWLVTMTGSLFSEWRAVLTIVIMGFLGISFYFYEPISGMTTPPMQWGYPREVEGFFHALSRGQYESINSENILQDPMRFVNQLWYVVLGLSQSFSWVFMFVGLLPFAFLGWLGRRERFWILGLLSVYLCLSVLLVILLNVTLDKSTADLNEVFFTASHMIFSIFIGLGLTLLAAYTATHFQRVRPWVILGGVISVGLAIFCLDRDTGTLFLGPAGKVGLLELPGYVAKAFHPHQYNLPILADLLLILIPLGFVLAAVAYRSRGPVLILLGLYCLMPMYSALTHWYKSEQRDHWFGYWFGHDMFTPPFGIYPEMTRDAILFGGTDPGRFCPTYMIFCESFIPHSCQPKEDQKFDRRDVYIITQNALADGTYLEYLRSQYNRSQQHDQYFFSELSKYVFSLGVHAWRKQMGSAIDINVDNEPDPERRAYLSMSENNYCMDVANAGLYGVINSCLLTVLDKPFTAYGASVEKRRRAEGVYPPKEIYIPSPEDSQSSFSTYTQDAARRQALNQLKPGENVHEENGRVSVSGQVAVMEINGLLCRVIFDHNPTNEFFVEESFPLDWMYPYETPFGIIMKINRQPVTELGDDVFKKDHAFWTKYSERLNGNWITYDTSVKDIAAFVDKTYIGNNLDGYIGNPKFLRDDDGQKAFSKLRSSIAGMYFWRLRPTCPAQFRQKTEASQKALIREADFAFKQAFAFCPYSPEAVFRYVEFLLQFGRLEDALVVATTCQKLDPFNSQIGDLINQLNNMKSQPGGYMSQGQPQMDQLEAAVKRSPNDPQALYALAMACFQTHDNDRGNQLMMQALASPQIAYNEAAGIANLYVQMNDLPHLEPALRRIAELRPDEPEARYDLAALESILGKPSQAITDLKTSLDANAARLKQNPSAKSLLGILTTDRRFDNVRQSEAFKQLVSKY